MSVVVSRFTVCISVAPSFLARRFCVSPTYLLRRVSPKSAKSLAPLSFPSQSSTTGIATANGPIFGTTLPRRKTNANLPRRAILHFGIIANVICESACERCMMNGNVYFVLCDKLFPFWNHTIKPQTATIRSISRSFLLAPSVPMCSQRMCASRIGFSFE